MGGCFQQGIAQYIFERYQLNKYRERIHVGGASTGAPTVGYLLASIHNIKTPKEWFYSDYCQVFEKASERRFGCLFWTSTEIERLGIDYIRQCEMFDENFLDKIRTYLGYHVSTLSGRSIFVDNFKTGQDFGTALKATTSLPFIGVFPLVYHNKHFCFDGDVLPRDINPKQIPTIIFGTSSCSSELSVQIDYKKWYNNTLYTMWIPGDVTEAHLMFERGYDSAKAHRNQLDDVFLPVLYGKSYVGNIQQFLWKLTVS